MTAMVREHPEWENHHMSKTHVLTPEAQAFLDSVFAKNTAIYGGLRMEAGAEGGDGSGDGSGSGSEGSEGGDGNGEGEEATAPKPTETVDYWKRRSRENEKRAKDNAEAAKKLQQLEDAKKTDEQKAAEAATKQQQETEALRLENLKLRAASTHNVLGEDAEGVLYSDLIHGKDEEEVNRSAEAIGRLVAAAQELSQLKEQQTGGPGTGRPRPKPGSAATPRGEDLTMAGTGGISEAERRFGKRD